MCTRDNNNNTPYLQSLTSAIHLASIPNRLVNGDLAIPSEDDPLARFGSYPFCVESPPPDVLQNTTTFSRVSAEPSK